MDVSKRCHFISKYQIFTWISDLVRQTNLSFVLKFCLNLCNMEKINDKKQYSFFYHFILHLSIIITFFAIESMVITKLNSAYSPYVVAGARFAFVCQHHQVQLNVLVVCTYWFIIKMLTNISKHHTWRGTYQENSIYMNITFTFLISLCQHSVLSSLS